MFLINRMAAILKPKKPFVDWINRTDPTEPPLSIDDARRDSTVILVPEFETEEEAISYVESSYDVIFEDELYDWYQDESLWPKNRTLELFRQWIKIEMHSMVFDTQEDPIEKDETEADEIGLN